MIVKLFIWRVDVLIELRGNFLVVSFRYVLEDLLVRGVFELENVVVIGVRGFVWVFLF